MWFADVEWEKQFNGGPRICIGQQFALTEASYVTVRLLQRFDRMESLLGNHERVRNHVTLINTVGNGVRVRLHAAAA
jgi:cytochrome P450